ncbi:MAG TPA: tetratricopeptide repeat protein [Polyangiaceae bacterium]|nr:tetratricopeptide repeat protein [Polyangiaceae bacterium]
MLSLAGCCWLVSASALAQSEPVPVPTQDLVSASAVARSEPEPPTATDDDCAGSRSANDPEAARVAFRAGQTAFSEGAYARAVELWNQAYRDDCTAHALLLNLAMAQELLGRPEDAIHTLTLFNRRSPTSPYVEANVKRIQRLERLAAEQRRQRARRERLDWGPANHPAPGDGASLSLPLAVTVVGGTLAVVGGALFIEGRMSASSADDRCGTRSACDEVGGVVEGERARSRAETGGWLGGVGLVTAAGGLVWHFLSQPERPLDQTAPASGVSLIDVPAGGAGVAWSESF